MGSTYQSKLKTIIQAQKDQAMTLTNIKKQVRKAEEEQQNASLSVQRMVLKAKAARQKAKDAHEKLDKLRGSEGKAKAVATAAAKEKVLGAAQKELAAMEAKCIKKACPQLDKLQSKVSTLRAEYQKAANIAGIEAGTSLDFSCGDGMFQNENGEECDDGNNKNGDGCDNKCTIEPGWSCTGGSWTHESVCDKCGNGIQQGQEECDDGNTVEGDGCSGTCKIEPGYTCTVPPGSEDDSTASVCQTLASANAKTQNTMNVIQRKSKECAVQGKSFVLNNKGDGLGGSCADRSNPMAPPGVKQHSSAHMSSLSGASTRTIGREAILLTCPAPLESAGGASPYAVCRESLFEVCHSEASTNRVCQFRKSLRCEEVCVAPRFCRDYKEGKLVYRNHGLMHAPLGKACCFAGCQVPKTWKDAGVHIAAEAWCLPFAQGR